MAVKNKVDEGLKAGEVITLVSLDIKTAFDAAWWPNIIKSLQDCGCRRNLYYLLKSYLNQRSAILSTSSIKMERAISRGCPQVSCCGPGLWNIQYNSLLNLNFAKQTKAIEFANDLILVIGGKTVVEAENFMYTELSKIKAWTKNYKIEFNDDKIKYLGIIMDNKFKFREHITYAAEKCTKLIYSLSKSVKIT